MCAGETRSPGPGGITRKSQGWAGEGLIHLQGSPLPLGLWKHLPGAAGTAQDLVAPCPACPGSAGVREGERAPGLEPAQKR